ncbi:DUF4296 domain-containing protein [Carboxylicivirga sp. N1Y90]|uniref:DUF4296 domain-containing protein n=1 Tax=Carboxylicivirga fragile TaxID=3417571 RepID=UPI003D331777|nr:DUF4296 domain-containing protein [Marinilabiliaceae bacterium N1Y90]
MIKYLVLSLFVVLVSCSDYEGKADFIPDEDDMALLLADVYEVEAAISQAGRSINKEDSSFVGYYRQVLNGHGLTKLEFDSAVSWYSANPLIFADVYDEVISILSERDAFLKQEMSKERDQKSDEMALMRDVEDLWKGKRKYKLPFDEGDSTDVFLPFEFELDSLKNGILRLHARYKFGKANELDSASMKMITLFADSTRDTLVYHIPKSFKSAAGSLALPLKDQRSLISIEGLLFEHDTAKVSDVEINEVKLTFIPTVFKGPDIKFNEEI